MSNPETLLPVHPRTGLRAVGVVAGRPVWPVLGAEDDPANPVPPPAPGTLPQDPPPAAPPAPPAPVPAPPPGDPAPVFDAAYVQGLRHESASYRTRAKEQETAREAAEKAAQEAAAKATQLEGILAGLSKVLNGDSADETPDPEKLAQQLAAEKAQAEKAQAAHAADLASRDARIRELTVAAALPAAFAKANADPELTHAVLVRDGALAQLDPSSKTFAADLASAVASAVEANPKLKVTPVVTRSGTEPTGRLGGEGQITREQLATMTPEQIVKAQSEGRLKALTGGG